MSKQFRQVVWNAELGEDWEAILRLAIREDFGEQGDWTTRALVPDAAFARAAVVAREPGVLAGLPGVPITLAAVDPRLRWSPQREDGQAVQPGDRLGIVDGPARGLLMVERILLNFLGRLCGIATLTRRYVEAAAGTRARIFDTRKTTPGWRRLEKYAVRCGGGWNHRTGLHEAVLIKDNHLAFGRAIVAAAGRFAPAEAVARARQFLEAQADPRCREMIIEVEVDSLEQLAEVLPAGADLVLLDNMTPDDLLAAVALRDRSNPAVELEASGGVSLASVGEIARAGVERISVGALTHSAPALDLAVDWL